MNKCKKDQRCKDSMTNRQEKTKAMQNTSRQMHKGKIQISISECRVEWLQYPKSQKEMRNNKLYKLYKGGRNFTAKIVDGDYYPEIHTLTHTHDIACIQILADFIKILKL